MAFMVNVHPAVRIDIMVPQKYWPKLVGLFPAYHANYYKEDWMELPNGHDYICLRDVKSESMHELGMLLTHIERMNSNMEAERLNDKESKIPEEKFYILIKPRKKGKTNAKENRKETGAGSEGGNRGESGNSESEPVNEPNGVGSEIASAWALNMDIDEERIEPESTVGDDQ